MMINGRWEENITCPVCRFRHPASTSCVDAQLHADRARYGIGVDLAAGPDVTVVQLSSDDDDGLRDLWRLYGGKFHGPNVETGTMPEEKLLPFLRALIEGTLVVKK